MSPGGVLAIDQGTSSTKALLIDADGRVLAQASRRIETRHHRPGWAEQDGEEIWRSVVEVIADIVARGHAVDALAITNQRETVGLWDLEGRPAAPFVLWQCRRTSERCAALRESEALVTERTGLAVDPMFSATKLAWLLDNTPDARPRSARGELRAGTVDAWILWRLTAGGVHATDHSNASRTQLMNLDTLEWDPGLADLFGVPVSILPAIRPSQSEFGVTVGDVTALPAGVPIRAMLGDSHAAAFGHGLDGPGRAKATCGTGSSLMTITGRRVRSRHGLSETVAWSDADGALYALEGNIVVSGQALSFAARLLGLQNEQDLFDLAAATSDNGGVVFVPAMAGLGAPYWRDDARGAILGMTLGVTPAHLARAAVEAVALQIHDVFRAMEADLGSHLPWLAIDGGAAANDRLASLIADVIDRPVRRPASREFSAFGAARLASHGLGRPFAPPVSDEAAFDPTMKAEDRERLLDGWRDAIARVTLAPASSP